MVNCTQYYRGVKIEAENQQPSINCKVFYHLATLNDIYGLYSILHVYASHLLRLKEKKKSESKLFSKVANA